MISLCLSVFRWRQPTLSAWLAMSRVQRTGVAFLFTTVWQTPVDLLLWKPTYFSTSAREPQSLRVQVIPALLPSSEKNNSRCFLIAKSGFLQPYHAQTSLSWHFTKDPLKYSFGDGSCFSADLNCGDAWKKDTARLTRAPTPGFLHAASGSWGWRTHRACLPTFLLPWPPPRAAAALTRSPDSRPFTGLCGLRLDQSNCVVGGSLYLGSGDTVLRDREQTRSCGWRGQGPCPLWRSQKPGLERRKAPSTRFPLASLPWAPSQAMPLKTQVVHFSSTPFFPKHWTLEPSPSAVCVCASGFGYPMILSSPPTGFAQSIHRGTPSSITNERHRTEVTLNQKFSPRLVLLSPAETLTSAARERVKWCTYSRPFGFIYHHLVW